MPVYQKVRCKVLSEKTIRADTMKELKEYILSFAEPNCTEIDTRTRMQYLQLLITTVGAILPPIVNAIMQYYFSK
jgi:hypothetical protein